MRSCDLEIFLPRKIPLLSAQCALIYLTWLTSLYDCGASSAAIFLVAMRTDMPAEAISDSTWTQHKKA